MNHLPPLTDHELHGTLLNALRCAADHYRDNAKALADAGLSFGDNDASRLAEQFDLQAREADALAERLERRHDQ